MFHGVPSRPIINISAEELKDELQQQRRLQLHHYQSLPKSHNQTVQISTRVHRTPKLSISSSPFSIDHQPLNSNSQNGGALELFVGNLSYFCEERHLYDLFNTYSNVLDARIMRGGDDNKRSLLYGFVTLSSLYELEEMSKLLNNHLLLGRRMRVEIPSRVLMGGKKNSKRSAPPPTVKSQYELQNECQLHVSISSYFHMGEIVIPTEMFLRKAFLRFGSIVDIQVNWYSMGDSSTNRQEGYAFVTFESQESYDEILRNPIQHVQGITLLCTKSRIGFRHGNGTILNPDNTIIPTVPSVVNFNETLY